MVQRRRSRTASTTRTARECYLPSRAPKPAPVKSEAGEVSAQVRAANRTEWTDPLNEEELAALKAGWSFVE